jgi:hypothetical protein
MQEKYVGELNSNLVDILAKRAPKASREMIQASVDETFKQMSIEEKLMTLSEDEVDLILKFRAWGKLVGSASGVFHWKKQFGK